MERISVVDAERKSLFLWISLPEIARNMWRTARFVVDPTYFKLHGTKG
jgi:hypothetical protein|tara:strand:+ start:37 stop:180 length:144 start_codon:yes stop_codon:yes gene_type:complete